MRRHLYRKWRQKRDREEAAEGAAGQLGRARTLASLQELGRDGDRRGTGKKDKRGKKDKKKERRGKTEKKSRGVKGNGPGGALAEDGMRNTELVVVKSGLVVCEPRRPGSELGLAQGRDASFASQGYSSPEEGEHLFDKRIGDVPEVIREFQSPSTSKGKVLDKHAMKFAGYF